MRYPSWKQEMRRWLLTAGVLAGVGTCSAGPAWADSITYMVTINTSAIHGTSGNLDLQFNPGALPGTQLAVASVEGFTSDGTLGTATPTGDVTGTLPGTLSFDNQTVFNDDFQSLVFGNTIQFEILLSGPAVLNPDGTSTSGSSFGIGLWDSSGTNPLLTSDPNGFVGIANINLDGSATTTTFATATNGPPALTFTSETTTSPVPEPSSLLLLATGIAGVAGIARKSLRERGC